MRACRSEASRERVVFRKQHPRRAAPQSLCWQRLTKLQQQHELRVPESVKDDAEGAPAVQAPVVLDLRVCDKKAPRMHALVP